MKREDFAAMIPKNDKYVGSNIYLNGKNAGFEECLQMIKENMDNLKCANCKCFSKIKCKRWNLSEMESTMWWSAC